MTHSTAATLTRPGCPPWCISTHHGEGPGQLDPVLHHYSASVGTGLVVDLEQNGPADPWLLLTNPDDHSEVRLPAGNTDGLMHALATLLAKAREVDLA